jgi:hypothetical protein
MRRFCTTIVLAFATFLSISICSAQQTATTSVPNLVRYSGTLKDAQGAALSSSTAVGVTFSIYKQQDGGAAVWMETQNVTPDSNGQYSVILGSTTATGLPDDLFSQQEQRWLGVQVQGQAEQARLLLVSVPYAFKAHEAETLGGLPPSAFVKAAPDATSSGSAGANKGTSVTTSSAAANANGPADSVKPSGGVGPVFNFPCPNAGNPAPLYIPLFFPSGGPPPANVICNSVIFQTPLGPLGNVGINTTTPGAQLDVNGGTTSGINTTNNRKAYMIGLSPVLTVFSGAGNLFAGLNAGINNPLNTNSGTFNTFVGQSAGTVNTTGGDNAFFGATAGTANVNGRLNTFIGSAAGHQNVGGSWNTFVGWDAGGANVNSSSNTYVGFEGAVTMTGANNTCVGAFCGNNFTNPITGGNNIFVGASAGSSSGGNSNNNIYMGNTGAPENSTIRIGTQNLHLSTYIAGIYGNPNTNLPSVLVDNTGRLWQGPTGGVTGNCPLGLGYITQWLSTNTVGCSLIYQVPNGLFAGFIGIGTTNPSTALDVNGDINAKYDLTSYQIKENTVLQAFGPGNLFVGFNACPSGSGGQNTFVGSNAGSACAYGNAYNTFVGAGAGASNATGQYNTFLGAEAGQSNVAGNQNVSIGQRAGYSNNSNNNVFVGTQTGSTNTGHANIYIGAYVDGVPAAETNTIRIGFPCSAGHCGLNAQFDAYIAGIYASTPNVGTGPYKVVCIANDSKLWGAPFNTDCTVSSRRFKENILDMGDSSSKLFQLRPVSFFYKPQYDDGSHLQQYGLIAEEVAKVYPEMVAYDRDGQPYTVKYQLLAPMLLNELQKQHTVVTAQQDEMQSQRSQIKTQQQQMQAQRHEIDGLKLQLQQQNASLQERLSKLESYVATQMKTASDNPPRTTPGANGGLQ